MSDLNRNSQATQTSSITGGDELYKADVISDFDGKNKLLVKSDTAISTELSIEQQTNLNQLLNNVTYYSIYSAVGIKTVSGFALEFSNRNIFVKLELDGVVIFDLDISKLRNILDWNQSPLPPFYVSWNDNLKAFYFTPAFPIKSQTSVVISARGRTGTRYYYGGIIQVGWYEDRN